ncbi:lipase-like domain-containing protein [Staphylococcus aureus]
MDVSCLGSCQTIRQLEELLRNGSREEIGVQKKHGWRRYHYSKVIMTI